MAWWCNWYVIFTKLPHAVGPLIDRIGSFFHSQWKNIFVSRYYAVDCSHINACYLIIGLHALHSLHPILQNTSKLEIARRDWSWSSSKWLYCSYKQEEYIQCESDHSSRDRTEHQRGTASTEWVYITKITLLVNKARNTEMLLLSNNYEAFIAKNEIH